MRTCCDRVWRPWHPLRRHRGLPPTSPGVGKQAQRSRVDRVTIGRIMERLEGGASRTGAVVANLQKGIALHAARPGLITPGHIDAAVDACRSHHRVTFQGRKGLSAQPLHGAAGVETSAAGAPGRGVAPKRRRGGGERQGCGSPRAPRRWRRSRGSPPADAPSSARHWRRYAWATAYRRAGSAAQTWRGCMFGAIYGASSSARSSSGCCRIRSSARSRASA